MYLKLLNTNTASLASLLASGPSVFLLWWLLENIYSILPGPNFLCTFILLLLHVGVFILAYKAALRLEKQKLEHITWWFLLFLCFYVMAVSGFMVALEMIRLS